MAKMSSYPGGFLNGVMVRGVPVLNSHSGNVYWVDSGIGSDGNSGKSPEKPWATLDYAVSRCTASNGDIIFIAPGHAETISTATALAVDVPGVSIVGLGTGALRPTFTVGTAATATITFSAANCSAENIIVKSNLDGLNTAITVTGTGVYLDIEHQDASSAIEADIAIACSGDQFTCKLRDIGFAGGDQRDQSITLDGVDNARIDIDFYGKVATAVVNFITASCTDVEVRGTMYVSGTTDGTKNVVDTIGSSTWYMEVNDAAAGAKYTGGSAAAVASDDVSAINAKIGTITNTGGTATVGGVLGDVSNVTVATSLAKIGTITNTGGTATIGGVLGDVSNVSVATSLAKFGTITNTGGTATLGGVLGDVSNVSVATRMKQQEQCSSVALAAADFTGTTTRFTVTGPIEVNHLGLLLTTGLPAGANTLKFSFTPSGGAATDLSGATDTASAGAQQLFLCDGVKATALVKTTDVGIGVFANEHMPIVLGSGVIQTIFSAGPPASGAGTVFLDWKPLIPAATVA